MKIRLFIKAPGERRMEAKYLFLLNQTRVNWLKLWVSGLIQSVPASTGPGSRKFLLLGWQGGRSPRRSNLIVRDIGGDKPGGMPVTGRTHIFFAQPMHVYRGVSPEGILFCWGWIFRYFIWDFVSSFFFCTSRYGISTCARLSRVIARWGPHFVGNFRSSPSVFDLSPIWTGLCALPLRGSLILDSGTSAPSGDNQLTWE